MRTNQIPRQVPPAPKYLRLWASTLICGFLPFGEFSQNRRSHRSHHTLAVAAFLELYLVLSSFFASRAYYAWGFISATGCVVALTTATTTILLVYFLLCAEEWRWHWRAFFAGGGSAVWLILYGCYYWMARLSLDSYASVVLYFGYVFIFATFIFLMCGTVGFVASYWSVKRLYSAIRID